MLVKHVENFFKSVQFNRQSHDTLLPNRHLALVGRKNSPFPERNLWQMFLREGHSCVGQIINTLELCRTAQGTNNMHNCPNSDALQVFFIQNGGPPDTNYVEVFQITSQSDFQSVTATSCGYTKCSKYPRLLIDERFLSFSWP